MPVSGVFTGGNLRSQHLPRHLDIDQRIDIEFGRDDIGPFVQDAMKLVIAFDIEHRGRATADARIDVLANTRCLVSVDPGPKTLSLCGDLRGAFGARRGDDEKQGAHNGSLREMTWKCKTAQTGTISRPIGHSAM